MPQNRAWLIERFIKYHSTKEAGLNFIVPFIDRIAADRSLEEQAQDVPSQSAITKDNISLIVDGVLYFEYLILIKQPMVLMIMYLPLLSYRKQPCVQSLVKWN